MSLMVTFEVAKLIQGMFMEWDEEMTITVQEPGEVFYMLCSSLILLETRSAWNGH